MAIRPLRFWLALALVGSVVSPVAAEGQGRRAKARAPKAAPEAPRVTSVLSATHPQVTQESMAADSLLRISGLGFGDAADTHAILKAAGVEDGLNLTVVSWKDSEVVVKLPSVTQLGIDPATAKAIEGEVRPDKPLVSMRVSIALVRGATNLAEPIALRIALAAYDFDNDGVARAQDANDLDPQVH